MQSRPPRDDAGISAVIGVILLVAIALAIALTIFLAAKRYTDETAETDKPLVSFDKVGDTWVRVVDAPAGNLMLDWADDLRISGSCTPTLNGAAYPGTSGTPVQAGDVLECPPDTTLVIATSEAQGDTVLYRTTFG